MRKGEREKEGEKGRKFYSALFGLQDERGCGTGPNGKKETRREKGKREIQKKPSGETQAPIKLAEGVELLRN